MQMMITASFIHALRCRMIPLVVLLGFITAAAVGQSTEDSTSEHDVEVTSFGTVDMAVHDADLVQILEMLSIQSQKNIIAGRDVSATVTANLYDVTFEEALDAILRVNGYGYVEEGSFIYVYPVDKIAEIEATKRKLETRIFELFYLNARDANQVVIPLLSEAGSVVPLGEVADGFNPDESSNGTDSYAYAAKVVVTDYPDRLEQIASVLKDLDVSPEQVMVEATILQTTVTENNAFGVDFSLVSHLNFSELAGGPLAAVDDLITGNTKTDNALASTSVVGRSSNAGSEGFKVGVVKDDFSIFLRALDKVTDVTVVARPKVMCLNRQRAEILVGKRLGYLNSTQTETSTTQTVEFLDTGIHLMFRPFITANKMIRLELYPRLSNGNVTITQGLTIPNEDTHEIFTNVRVKSGETIVLGGLFDESTKVDREQVPLLGDIPIIGTAFKGQDDVITRKEIIFLLTPTLIEDERLWQMGEDGLEILDAVQLGARSGLLPFSRDQLTADYNRDAIDAYRAGDLDRALYFANNSLRTSSLQPEMVRFRDTLSRSSRQAWQRSMHQRLIDGELTPGQVDSNEANDLQSVPDSDAVDVGSLEFPSLDPQDDGFGKTATATVAAGK
jgi:type IV pilus assembly protein PilQ